MSKASSRGERRKTRYRTRTWREYDRGLIARGDLTVWLSPDLALHLTLPQRDSGLPD
ncbi:hypothetical protein [Roseomonas sp. WA12]